jgi:phage terminase large subunit-like protein
MSSRLERERKLELLELLEEKERRRKLRFIHTMYPEEGPLSRHNYPKHMAFFESGTRYRERAAMGANRSGKTLGCTGYELSLHLTGEYPAWWIGRRFDRPIRAWAAGHTAETTRDTLQRKLMGPINAIGTGLILGERITDYKRASGGVPDCIETVYVKNTSGGISTLGFKAYKDGRKAFEGDELDVVCLDEEPPVDIYSECVIRTMTTNGMVIFGFTPLEGLSDTVLRFLPGGKVPDEQSQSSRFIVNITWEDAPHLTEKDKREILDACLPHERDARSKGIPAIGSGRVYPLPEEDLLVADFPIPDYFFRAGAFDPGWNNTAAVWGAYDGDNDIWYLYSEYKRQQAEPVVHASSILSRGDWIPFVGDPASRASSQKDGEKLIDEYNRLKLKLSIADNAVEAGILDVYTRMTTGRLKIFKSLSMLLEEFRIYRRDKNGKIVKDRDHLMDCIRYLIRSGRQVAKQVPTDIRVERILRQREKDSDGSYNPLTYGLDMKVA